MNHGRRFAPAGLIILVLAIFLLAAEAEQTNQAGLVVAFEDGQVETVCVRFIEAEISGFDLLQRSGLSLEVEAQGQGAAVCRIEDQGCPAGNCFCQCRGDDCRYWSYWHQIDGIWEYSAAGAATYRVRPGDVDGWSWGPGSVTDAIEPPIISLAEICAAPATETSADQPAAINNEATDTSTLNWFSLGIFILLVGGLAVGLLVLRRQKSSE